MIRKGRCRCRKKDIAYDVITVKSRPDEVLVQ